MVVSTLINQYVSAVLEYNIVGYKHSINNELSSLYFRLQNL